MIKLKSIRIENYKSFKSETIHLSDFTPIVGLNNAGKSNLLNSILWLLKKSVLPKESFNDIGSEINIIGVIDGLTDEVLEGLGGNHRASVEPFINEGSITIKRNQPTPSCPPAQVRLYMQNPENDEWNPNPAGIENAIKSMLPEPIVIGAMENSEEDVSKWKTSTTIGKLINEILSPIKERYGGQVDAAMNQIKGILSADGDNRAEELTAFDEAVNGKINSFFPGVNIKLHIPTPELKEVFKSGTIKIYEDDREGGINISDLGTGAQRSIQMALIRHLADVKTPDDVGSSRTLLLIDEPELYLHPTGIEQVRAALKELSKEGYQIIFNTHSPLMTSSSDISNTVLIRKNTVKGTHRLRTIKEAVEQVVQDYPSQIELLFNLSNSSQILFSEKVLLTEGRTEHKILPSIIESIANETIVSMNFALIKQGGVDNTSKCIQIIESIGLKPYAIVDLDYAFRGAIINNLIPNTDANYLACLAKIQTYEDENLTKLNDGLPTNKNLDNGMLKVSQIFEKLAIDCPNEVNNLHEILRGKQIYLWKKGTIETHCELEGKNESIWSAFVNRLNTEGVNDVLNHKADFEDLLTWMKTA